MDNVLTWIVDNWQIPAGVATFIASFLIPGARRIWPIMLRALLSPKAIAQVVIYLGDALVKSTKTNIDNTLWAPVRKALFEEISK